MTNALLSEASQSQEASDRFADQPSQATSGQGFTELNPRNGRFYAPVAATSTDPMNEDPMIELDGSQLHEAVTIDAEPLIEEIEIDEETQPIPLS